MYSHLLEEYSMYLFKYKYIKKMQVWKAALVIVSYVCAVVAKIRLVL